MGEIIPSPGLLEQLDSAIVTSTPETQIHCAIRSGTTQQVIINYKEAGVLLVNHLIPVLGLPAFSLALSLARLAAFSRTKSCNEASGWFYCGGRLFGVLNCQGLSQARVKFLGGVFGNIQ